MALLAVLAAMAVPAVLAAMAVLAARAVPVLLAGVAINVPGLVPRPRRVVPPNPFESSQSSCCIVQVAVWGAAFPYIEILALQERQALLDILVGVVETRREDNHLRLAEQVT